MTAGGLILQLDTERGWRGGQLQLALLAAGLTAPWRCVVACRPGEPLAADLSRRGVAIEALTPRSALDPLAIWHLRRLVVRLRPVAVHAHTSHTHQLALLACAGTGVPVLVTRRVDFPLKRGLVARWKYGAVRQWITVSSAVAAVMQAGGVPATRVTVIRDGIDPARHLETVPTLRAELGLQADALLVGITAALEDHKDHRTLLAAWQQVEAAVPRAHLVVAGDGALRAVLAEQSRALGLRRCHFLGFRSDVPALLRALDVFTLSSKLEGLGSSVMDAQWCGLPVVATAAGGIPELVRDGVTGLLVPVGDAPALAAALRRVLGDADLRRRLGAAGRAAADPAWTAARMVDEHTMLYAGLR